MPQRVQESVEVQARVPTTLTRVTASSGRRRPQRPAPTTSFT
jgi:hypothetical protein